MASKSSWVSANKAGEILGLDRKTFQYHDGHTEAHKLRSFFKHFSRDSYRWNVVAVKKHLQEVGVFEAADDRYKRFRI